MSSILTIRVLQSEDAEQYLNLRLEGLRENPEAFGSTYEETIRDENLLETYKKRLDPTRDKFTMGAFENDTLISVVTLIREKSIKIRHKASLFAVYTTPNHRGRGVAKELLKKLLEKAKELEGLEQINLAVVNQNKAAYKLYLSVGFQVFGTERNAMKHNDVYWDEDYMVLVL